MTPPTIQVACQVKSVKVFGASNSVSVKTEPRQPASLSERKRLSERTSGMWKNREVDGLLYQEEQRAEWEAISNSAAG